NESGDVSDTLSAIFTLDAVQAAVAGKRAPRSAAKTTRSSSGNGVVRRRVAAVADTVEQDKYAYFRAHRDELPEDVVQYASEISMLMRAGKSAEDAFKQIIEQHY